MNKCPNCKQNTNNRDLCDDCKRTAQRLDGGTPQYIDQHRENAERYDRHHGKKQQREAKP